MTTKRELKDVQQPPQSPDKHCPRCGAGEPRRTHETKLENHTYYTLCRCTTCWAVYWAANVAKLEW